MDSVLFLSRAIDSAFARIEYHDCTSPCFRILDTNDSSYMNSVGFIFVARHRVRFCDNVFLWVLLGVSIETTGLILIRFHFCYAPSIPRLGQ
jgi:hypothetical protein